jgi:hypothetical protein
VRLCFLAVFVFLRLRAPPVIGVVAVATGDDAVSDANAGAGVEDELDIEFHLSCTLLPNPFTESPIEEVKFPKDCPALDNPSITFPCVSPI